MSLTHELSSALAGESMKEISGLPEFWEEFCSLGQEVDYFVTARLFDGTPAAWPHELSYIRWRHLVATELGVDPMAVQLVGSARLGYSLNPKKDFKKFHEKSDLDIAVISPELFDQAWRELREIIEDEIFTQKKNYLASWFSKSVLPLTSYYLDCPSASSGHGREIFSYRTSGRAS